MTDAPKLMTTADMLKFVDEPLFQAIEATINEHACKGKLTTSAVEMTLAAFLGTLIGESCPTKFEVEINAKAYGDVVKAIGLCGGKEPEREQNEALN